MTFDMRSRRFWNKSDTSWKYPASIFVRRSIFHRNTIYRSVIIEVNWSPQISAHKEDGVSFSLLFLCASWKTHRQTVCASAVNLLRHKRKKRTLAETLSMRRIHDHIPSQLPYFPNLNTTWLNNGNVFHDGVEVQPQASFKHAQKPHRMHS